MSCTKLFGSGVGTGDEATAVAIASVVAMDSVLTVVSLIDAFRKSMGIGGNVGVVVAAVSVLIENDWIVTSVVVSTLVVVSSVGIVGDDDGDDDGDVDGDADDDSDDVDEVDIVETVLGTLSMGVVDSTTVDEMLSVVEAVVGTGSGATIGIACGCMTIGAGTST